MKKAEQEKINESVLEFLDNVNRELPAWWKEVKPCERLDYCQAWVYDLCGYKLLVSYNTFVAAVDSNGNGYDFLRFVFGYTATSAKHISKFFHRYANNVKTYRA